MKQIEIVSTVVNGKLKRNRNRLLEAIESFEGKTIDIRIKLHRKERSNAQNRYYWGVIIPIWAKLIRTEWGEYYDAKDTHDFLKFHCNYDEKINMATGEIVRVARSTKDNTTTEQEDFHEKARRLAMEMFNVQIPLPNEQVTLKVE